jgi:PAS domain S-box-containing protein
MKKKPNRSPDAAERRRLAEERLKDLERESRTPKIETDAQRTIHELHVHQIELEMQNIELLNSRNEMETLLKKYTDLYDFSPVGYFSLDKNGLILEVNLTGAALLDTNRAQLVRQPLSHFLTPESRPGFSSFLENVFADPRHQSCELELLRDGKSPVEIRIEAESIASKAECRAVIEDITGRKQAEKDRLVLNKLESTGILAGGLAHDFNNLLTVISLSLEMVRKLSPSEGDLDTHLENAEKTALAAHGLTQQLITFAEGGRPVLKPIHLSTIIHESARAALSGSGIQCTFSLADDLWPVEADARQIEQVIRNLLLNAREAMPQTGTVSIRAENITPADSENPSRPPEHIVRISITDQGSGIAKEILPKIFDPYFSTKKRGDQKGMGLGWTICHAIVTKHHGTLAVESAPGAGAVFIIQFPAFMEISAEENPPLPAELPHSLKILVMDDEKGLQAVLGLLLRNLGHDVELTTEGKSTVEVYNEAMCHGSPFDIVILDLTIRNGMGGLETIQELLKIDPSVTAIVMSGYADDPALLDPVRYGFKDSLTKPFNSDNLKACISRVIKGCFDSISRHA